MVEFHSLTILKCDCNRERSRMSGFDLHKHKPSEYDPGTQVHILVEKLKSYLDESF